MKIQTTPPSCQNTPKPPGKQPDPPNPDKVELSGAKRYLSAALNGVTTLTPPLLGGMAYGVPGALGGGAVSFAGNYAMTKDARGSAVRSGVATLVGALASGGSLTAWRGAAAVGIGAAAGVLAALRADLEGQVREQGPIRHINKPGERVDVEKNLVSGRTNIVCFGADWCPGCQKAEPLLEKLCTKKPGYVTLKVDIKNWDSDVSKQFDLKAIPCYLIYDAEGKLVASGDEAMAQVKQLFK